MTPFSCIIKYKFNEGVVMKIFEFDSAEDMKDGAVAELVDGDGNPVEEETEDQRKARIAQENVAALAESEQADDQKI